MEKISSYLEKFSKLTLPNETIRKSIAEIIKEELREIIEIKDISINKNVAYVRGGSGLKSEIFLKKNKILQKIEEVAGKKEIIDIR